MLRFDPGLTLPVPAAPQGAGVPEVVLTEEAGVRAPLGQALRVTPLVAEGDLVAQGAPVAGLRDAPGIVFVAPMPGRVARIGLKPGARLTEIVLFHEAGGDVLHHATGEAGSEPGLRHLMQAAGIWPWLRRRPFGGMPEGDERPVAIVVMAADTRPQAPDPRLALAGREAAFRRGLEALGLLTDGPVLVVAEPGAALVEPGALRGRMRAVSCGARHPQGLAGLRIHDLCPAGLEAPVWDIHAEDVAALGDLLDTGVLPMTRLVSVAGAALREGRLVRTQPGADLRGLTHRLLKPGAHRLLSGSPIDGHAAHWLAPRHRQVSALPHDGGRGAQHWLVAALTRSASPRPVIPTAALTQAFGAALPAAAFVRALSAGDDEMAMKLGILSFLEEDIALADYVLGGEAELALLLRGMLERIRKECAA